MGGWVSTHHNLSGNVSSHCSARGGKRILQLSKYYTSISAPPSAKSRPRTAGAITPRIIPTFHYTPFPFRFFPTGLKALQTGSSVASVANLCTIRHVHAFLRRYNTTTTWFGSDAFADHCRSEAGFGGSVGNEGHRRSVWVTRPAARTYCRILFPLVHLSSPSMVRTSLFHHSDYRTNHHIPPPRKKERLGSRVAKRAFFSF